MCGIAGAVVFDDSAFQITPEYLTRMRDAMAHRGPDGTGLWIEPGGRLGLAHRRLTIIDLSTSANQPMTTADGRLRIVYNGEIYNHAEVKRELNAIGSPQWLTDHSDTEVILNAFAQWGIDCLQRLRGMFAFALSDARTGDVWLARDRMGIKPLYYSAHHGRMTFGSEIKVLLQDPEQPRRVHEESLFHYLSFLTAPAPHTFFAGIMKLEPASWMRVSRTGKIERRRYWDVWDHTQPMRTQSDAEIAETVLDGLRDAVRVHKEGDVPVGCALSGGTDSSTNVALFAEGDSRPVHTFTIGYDSEYESSRNEFGYAQNVATMFGTVHHEKRLSQEHLLDFLPRMIRLNDEPNGDPVCVPVYYMSQMARDNGVKALQLGEGADELFCGYDSWNLRIRLQEYDDLPVPRVVKRAALAGLAAAGKSDEFYYEYLRRGAMGQPIFWSGSEHYTQATKERLLSERLRKQFAGRTSWEAVAPARARFLEKAWEPSHLNWQTYADLNLRLPELLMMRVDKMGMGASIEGRIPFLDHQFVELVMSIPTAAKTRNRELKAVLKRAVRGLIPDEIIDRPKQGFGVPVDEWLADRLGAYAAAELKTFCRESDLLHWPEIERLLADPRRKGSVWILLSVALWWKEFIK